MDWNPSDTDMLGLEWMPIAQGSVALDATNKMIGTSFDQSTSEATGFVKVPNVGFGQRGGLYAVEVYDNETAVGDTPASLEAVPNEDVTLGAWTDQGSGTTNIYTTIDEGSSAPNTGDYLRKSGVSNTYYGRFNTGTLSLTGKRILGVQLRVYMASGPTAYFSAGLSISGADYPSVNNVPGPSTAQWYQRTWYYNPSTRKPWTIADVQAFDTTDEFWLRGQTQAGVWSAIAVYTVALTVITMTENRLAVGVLTDMGAVLLTAGTPAAPAWNEATLTTPTGGTWTKDGTGRHLYTVRRINGGGSMYVPYLTSGETPSVGRSWDIRIDPNYGRATAMAGEYAHLHPFVQRTTAPADSVDSLPYTRLTFVEVSNGQNAEGEFSGAAATTYGMLRFVVNLEDDPTADLLIKIKRRSDNVQLGSTYTLTAAAAAAFPSLAVGGTNITWRAVQVQLASAATLAAATQYYVEFSSTADAAAPWKLSGPDAVSVGQVATYHGTTDAATVNGAAENTSIDIAFTISTVPAALASMTAALGSQTVTETVNCVAAIPRADLSWEATAYGASFAYYQIQRSEDGGTTWEDIAQVTVESVEAWKDYEARRGVAASYRIRAIRTDGSFSPWTAAGSTVTKPLLAGVGAYGATMYLVSNHTPAFNVAYEYRPGKDYTFPEAGEQMLGGAYLRDFQLGANPLENRGVIANWVFIVGAPDKTAAGVGWRAFDALRAIARASIPYVCVLDHRGNRLYAQLSVPSGNESAGQADADLYLADVSGAQLADTAFVVSVDA